jgi:UDP-glucuronate 4-epimerase
MNPILITGAAGFVGFHLSQALLSTGQSVIGLDNLNSYYDPALKEARLDQLKNTDGFIFVKGDITDATVLETIFSTHQPERIIHMAAQAGVRYSMEAPQTYIDTNVKGFMNLMEACRHHDVEHVIYASSSSVYGLQEETPFKESDRADTPISLYGATKRMNELMAHYYSHTFGIPTTGVRLFTVYGPWGRPDMAYFLFTKAILAGQTISVFNQGQSTRDFTFVDDAVRAILALLPHVPEGKTPHRILNIGGGQPEPLEKMISLLESLLGITAHKDYQPAQPGDVDHTFSDTTALRDLLEHTPRTPLSEGLSRFVDWYQRYFQSIR